MEGQLGPDGNQLFVIYTNSRFCWWIDQVRKYICANKETIYPPGYYISYIVIIYSCLAKGPKPAAAIQCVPI